MNSSRRQAIASASMAAARLHQTLQTPYDRPVDVFMLAQRLGLWLVAQPLEKAHGFYLREDNAAGVVLNSQHPETLQRFTCAHEIGHHVLGHASHTDDASTLQRMSDLALQEHQAQVFAAALLMPAPLVNRTLHQLGIGGPLQPADIYAVSRDMSVSYTAALWGLNVLGKISAATASELTRKGPRQAKDALRGGPSLTDARSDIWVLDDSADHTTVSCRVGDEIHIQLTEDLSTGHVWSFDDLSDPALRQPTEHADALWWDGGSELGIRRTDIPTFPPHPDGPLDVTYDAHVDADGASPLGKDQDELSLFTAEAPHADPDDGADFALPEAGKHLLIVRPREAGSFQIRLALRPAWDTAATAASTRLFTLVAIPQKTLPERGCAAPQIDLRVQELVAA